MIQVWRYFATMPSTYTSCQRSIVELLAEVIQEGIDGLKMFFFLLLSFRSFLRTWPSADCGPRVVPRNVLQVEALRNRANDYPAAHPPPRTPFQSFLPHHLHPRLFPPYLFLFSTAPAANTLVPAPVMPGPEHPQTIDWTARTGYSRCDQDKGRSSGPVSDWARFFRLPGAGLLGAKACECFLALQSHKPLFEFAHPLWRFSCSTRVLQLAHSSLAMER